MKRKLLTGLLATALAITALPSGTTTAHAAEVDSYTLQGNVINANDNYEVSVGDNVYVSGLLLDENQQAIDSDKWNFVNQEWFDENDIDIYFYSDYNNIEDAEKDMVAFNGTIPEEAFGKNVYKYYGAFLSSDDTHAVFAYAPSKYHVTHWDNSKTYTVDRNDDGNSVTVFTIQNSKKIGKKLTFPSSIKINKKSYKITTIGNYAIDNSNGTGITEVTLPSTIQNIRKEAFKGAKNLKSITIKGNVKSVGENAFQGINKKAVFKIKATKKNYNKIVKKIKKAGVSKTVTFKRIK
ncbi:MAG: leucine-rich repeat protein [Agathobacter sp.]|nr:leucine-rich repeat protein [Agathobacter sp.]